MKRPKYKIEFYEKSSGRCPTRKFLNSLQRKDVVFINRAFNRLEKYGLDLGRPYVGYLRDHIHELRVNIQCGICRMLYFFHDGHKFVITHGIKKKVNKVPDSEIEKAIEYREDYIKRKARE